MESTLSPFQQKLAELVSTCEPEIEEALFRFGSLETDDLKKAAVLELWDLVFGEHPEEPTYEEICEAMAHDAKRLGREDQLELF